MKKIAVERIIQVVAAEIACALKESDSVKKERIQACLNICDSLRIGRGRIVKAVKNRDMPLPEALWQ